MPQKHKYSWEEIFAYFPTVSEEEIRKNRSKYRRAYANRNKPHNWNKIAGKELPCQKPGCVDVSRRVIDLKDGGRIRYCDTHYDDWFAEYPS